MTKDTALKMAIEAMNRIILQVPLHNKDEKHPILNAINACKEALEQPTVAELNDEYLRDTYVEGLNQSAQEPVGWNEEEFNEIAYAYRICPAHKVNMVSERYQDLVAYVLSLKDKNT